MCVHGTVGTSIIRTTVCVRALYTRVPVNWNHKLLWVLEHAHNTTICTNTHKVQFHQDYSHMFRSFACYIFHNQLRGATYFITISNTEIPIHMELYLYLFMICDVLVLQDIEVQARKACCDWCGKALWNRLVGTCQLLPRRTLLPADVALAISSVKSNQSSNKTKQAKPNHSTMCVTTVLQVNSPSWLLK